ncbi:hypothetical protein AJ78_06269 [Emergomyces pasteurianus Ep9510]|uniref:Uncharacterized protein n=1 Tax=Emergomyces pasteurianus Ep9510 TaxID=1447872 RepID=A0A1J9QAR2_9EURO|nr:hypothetical protein AJ78_06269 [Emergomyces pasteurianus Ep9510]
MSVSKSEADIVFNRANVALARSQRLIASWLPPKTDEEIANTKTEEELQREEDEIFTPVPEKLGLGAPLPQSQADGSFNRTELSSNEKLRKQLLGKNYKKKSTSDTQVNSSERRKQQQYHHQSANSRIVECDEDDEDEGRSSLGRNKRQRTKQKTTEVEKDTTTRTTDGDGDGDGNRGNGEDNESADDRQRSTQRKKPASYLDELLSERSKKRKRKRKNQ